MPDLGLFYVLILFVVGVYSVVRLRGRLLRSGAHSSLLWCSRMKCFSVVDTEVTKCETGQSKKVTDCLLWPELHDCDQRCIK